MYLNNIEIKYILYGTKEYEESLKLRDIILRKPWNRSIDEDDLSLEEKNVDLVIGAFIKNILKGVIILHFIDEKICQIKYLAVYEDSQKIGIGKKLVREAEEYSLNNNFTKIFLESRKTAVNFYKNLNYNIIGDYFMPEFVPVIHIPMAKYLI